MRRPFPVTRRQCLASGALAAIWATFGAGPVQAQGTGHPRLRQGYQTNIWGMPTYYLVHCGALATRGIEVEEFAVPSGNLTMQQMVARQVDLGTYAASSFILGHDKGGLIAIAVIEEVGRTARVMARKDLAITKIEQLRGLKIANQTGSSTGNIFVDQIAPAAGLNKSDYQEVRMDVNTMVAALVAKTVDAMVNVEPYNSLAEADGIATPIMDYWSIDPMPVFMATTPEFVRDNAATLVPYLKAWREVARDFKQRPQAVGELIQSFYTSKGYALSAETLAKALERIEVDPRPPSRFVPYLTAQAEVLLREKKIAAIPDWSKALRSEFMERALND